MYANLLKDGILLEETPQGLKSVPVQVDDQAREVLLAMIRLGNEEISQALAKLFVAGVAHGRTMPHRNSA